MNDGDMADRGITAESLVDIEALSDDGQKRIVRGFFAPGHPDLKGVRTAGGDKNAELRRRSCSGRAALGGSVCCKALCISRMGREQTFLVNISLAKSA